MLVLLDLDDMLHLVVVPEWCYCHNFLEMKQIELYHSLESGVSSPLMVSELDFSLSSSSIIVMHSCAIVIFN